MAVVVKGAFAGVGGAGGNGSTHPNVWRREITCTEVRIFQFPITDYSERNPWIRLKGMNACQLKSVSVVCRNNVYQPYC